MIFASAKKDTAGGRSCFLASIKSKKSDTGMYWLGQSTMAEKHAFINLV